MAKLDASRLGDGGGTTTVKTPAEKAAIKAQVDSVVSKIKLNEATRNNPLTSVKPAPAAEQIGPMIGANLGRDAAYSMDKGIPLSTEQKTAGETYNVGQGLNPDGSKKKEISSETRDAFEIMKQTLRGWGLEDLAETYGSLMATGISAEAAMTKIKYDKSINTATNRPWNDAYNTRFKGNELRVAKGLNAYSEGEYLAVEDKYNDILSQYGLSNMIKPDAAGKRAQFAGYMGNDIAPPEFAERIKNVSERVLNMDPKIKAQFEAYYPSLNNTDLVSYFLNPAETLPVLKNKITAAEIGTVAEAAGPKSQYGISEIRAMDLAKFGVTREQALAGYQDIAEATPTGMKLSGIYGEEGIQYGQATAEDEFLKQDAQAKLKRNRLASKERASFQGSAGTTSSSLKKSTAGQI
jgi:hypothetical protein